VTAATLAAELERHFSARPHVGTVTHFEGWDVPRTAAHARAVLAGLGLDARDAVERVGGEDVFSAIAAVPAASAGAGMELWLVAGEKPMVGSKLEMRVFHTLEDAALADEYLAGVAARMTGREPDHP